MSTVGAHPSAFATQRTPFTKTDRTFRQSLLVVGAGVLDAKDAERESRIAAARNCQKERVPLHTDLTMLALLSAPGSSRFGPLDPTFVPVTLGRCANGSPRVSTR